MPNENCFLCNINVESLQKKTDFNYYDCKNCGEYEISRSLLKFPPDESARFKISALLKEMRLKKLEPIFRFDTDDNGRVNTSNTNISYYGYTNFLKTHNFPIEIHEILNRTLLNLSRTAEDSKKYGTMISLNVDNDKNIAFAKTKETFEFILQALSEDKLIEWPNGRFGPTDRQTGIKITVKGWNRIAQLESTNLDSAQGFVAIWFDPAMEKAREAIRTAIQNAGYQARFIDEKYHTKKIDSEMIAEIRKSRFLVADLTENRPSVYYEAGFAHALRLPVFLTCKKNTKVHFDLEHYPHTIWEETKLDEFSKKLTAWIEAEIGKGPIPNAR